MLLPKSSDKRRDVVLVPDEGVFNVFGVFGVFRLFNRQGNSDEGKNRCEMRAWSV